MTRSNIIRTIAEEAKLSQKDVKLVLDAFEQELVKALAEDTESVRLPYLGSFNRVWRESKERRNPKTQEKVQVPAHYQIVFKPNKYFTENVQASQY